MIELAPITQNKMTYEEAILYCQFCNHDGYTDWRLPTFFESNLLHRCWYYPYSGLREIVELRQVIPLRDV
jgi:hypothetical protein